MRTGYLMLTILALLTAGRPGNTQTTWHVAASGSDSGPTGTNGWTDAFKTISNAVYQAGSADYILVSNGIYTLTESIAVSKGVVIRSWHNGALDRTNTVINGGQAMRCVYLDHADAVLEGFAVINGVTNGSGGGIYIGPEGGTVRDCIITGCQATSATSYGGGISIYNDNGRLLDSLVCGNSAPDATLSRGGGGVFLNYGGLVSNCLVVSNSTVAYGGGVSIANAGLVDGCIIADNHANYAGGGYLHNGGVLQNSTLSGNYATNRGGGIFVYYSGMVDRCVLSNNYAVVRGGGATVRDDGTGTFRNCLFVMNRATNLAGSSYGGGIYIEGSNGIVANCTLVNNLGNYGGGLYLLDGSYATNCIIYDNSGYSSYYNYRVVSVGGVTGRIDYSCTMPMPSEGIGNITNAPMFVNTNAGNYRLTRDSPGVNEGLNQDWMAGALDLDGRRRIDRMMRQVDMGCFEYLPGGAMFGIR